MIPEAKPTLCLLGKIAEITKLAGFEYTKHFDYKVGGEIIALRSLNIRNGQLDLSEVHTVPREVSDALPRSKLKSGDIVLGYVGSKLGNLALIEEDDRFHLAPNVALIRPRDGVDPHFLLMFMQAPFYQNQLWALASSTGQPALSMANIRKSKIWLPSNRDQKAIASMVSNWDRAIETVEALIANARAQKQALMQQLLPQGTTPPKKRLPGFSGEWREEKLGSLADISKGEQKGRASLAEEGPVPVINGGITPSGYTDHPNTSADTITISEGGNSCGYVDLITQPFWCGGHCYALKNLKVERDYLFAVLKHRQREIMSLRVGSGLPNIQKKALSQFSIPAPPMPEQVKIGELAASADKEIAAHEAQLSALRQEKAALMQQLLTGKQRVKLPESEAA